MHYIRVLWLYFSDKETFRGLLLSPPCDVMMHLIVVLAIRHGAIVLKTDSIFIA